MSNMREISFSNDFGLWTSTTIRWYYCARRNEIKVGIWKLTIFDGYMFDTNEVLGVIFASIMTLIWTKICSRYWTFCITENVDRSARSVSLPKTWLSRRDPTWLWYQPDVSPCLCFHNDITESRTSVYLILLSDEEDQRQRHWHNMSRWHIYGLIKCCESFTRWFLGCEQTWGESRCKEDVSVSPLPLNANSSNEFDYSEYGLSVTTTQPLSIQWQSSIHRSPPLLTLWGNKPKVAIKLTRVRKHFQTKIFSSKKDAYQ